MTRVISLANGQVASLWQAASVLVLTTILLYVGWLLIRSNAPLQTYRRAGNWIIVAQLALFAVFQAYVLWWYLRTPTGRYLLPPHSDYFLNQVNAGLMTTLGGFAAAAVVVVLGIIVTRRNMFSQFGPDDWLGLTIGTLVVGWPGILVFLAMTFIMAVLGLLALVLTKHRTMNDRLMITPYIIPAAVITFFFSPVLLAFTHLNKIRIY